MKRFLLIFFLSLAGLRAAASDVELQVMKGVVPNSYDFYLHLPSTYSREGMAKPLIVFLHGQSCCGGIMSRARRYGTTDAICRGLDLDAVVVNPHNRGGAWSPKKLVALLDFMQAHYNVDSTRVYVLGMSLGGYGTMDLVQAYPHRVAAAMALCGGCTAMTYEGLAQVPLWIVHGTADRAVPVTCSRRVANWLKKENSDSLLIYSELPGVNHGALCRLFYHYDTYNWLMHHRLEDRTVQRDLLTITAATCRKPYDCRTQHRVVEKQGQRPEILIRREKIAPPRLIWGEGYPYGWLIGDSLNIEWFYDKPIPEKE